MEATPTANQLIRSALVPNTLSVLLNHTVCLSTLLLNHTAYMSALLLKHMMKRGEGESIRVYYQEAADTKLLSASTLEPAHCCGWLPHAVVLVLCFTSVFLLVRLLL